MNRKKKARGNNRSDTNQCQTYDKGDSHRKDGSEAENKKGKIVKNLKQIKINQIVMIKLFMYLKLEKCKYLTHSPRI